jgi:hypothetical protein
MRRLATLLLVLTAAAALGAAPASAEVGEVVQGLRADRLYVAPTAGINPDRRAVLRTLDQATVPTYIAVVPQAEADAQELGIDGLLLRIIEQLAEPSAVVLVVTDGQQLQAGEGATSFADPAGALDQVLVARLDEPFTPETLTSALIEFTERVDETATAAPAGDTRRTVGLVGLVAVAAVSGGWFYLRASRRALAPTPLSAGTGGPDDGGWQGGRQPEGTVEP